MASQFSMDVKRDQWNLLKLTTAAFTLKKETAFYSHLASPGQLANGTIRKFTQFIQETYLQPAIPSSKRAKNQVSFVEQFTLRQMEAFKKGWCNV